MQRPPCVCKAWTEYAPVSGLQCEIGSRSTPCGTRGRASAKRYLDQLTLGNLLPDHIYSQPKTRAPVGDDQPGHYRTATPTWALEQAMTASSIGDVLEQSSVSSTTSIHRTLISPAGRT